MTILVFFIASFLGYLIAFFTFHSITDFMNRVYAARVTVRMLEHNKELAKKFIEKVNKEVERREPTK